jgi:Flp pilus assembly protein TadG
MGKIRQGSADRRRGGVGFRGALKRWCKSVSGNVTVEFAFVIPVLVMIGMGAFDFGRMGLQKITVSSAALAGAQYGTQDFVTAAHTAGMIQAARNDANDTNNELTVTARQYCSCPTDGEVACTATCSDSSFNFMYVDVTVQDDLTILFAYPGVSKDQTIVSTSTMRVR